MYLVALLPRKAPVSLPDCGQRQAEWDISSFKLVIEGVSEKAIASKTSRRSEIRTMNSRDTDGAYAAGVSFT